MPRRAAIAAIFIAGSFAQDLPDGEPLEVLEELVVTGEKERKPVADVAASVAVVGEERIEKSRLDNVGDVFRQVANVQAPVFNDGGFVIRGINTEAPDAENVSGSQQPMASIYVDGVALTQGGSRRGPLGMWDVEQVEVFRGPQSTIQGRNSLAGAVHIRTKDPTFDWEGASRTTVGSRNWLNEALMLSGPLGRDFAFRLTAEAYTEDSQIHYPNLVGQPGYDDLRTSEFWNTRGKLLYQPSDDFKLLFSYSHSFARPTANDVFGPNAPGAPAGLSFYDRVWLSASPQQQLRDAHSDVASIEAVWQQSERLRWTSITSYSGTETGVDTVGGDFDREDREREYVQEIRANYEDDRTRAVGGLYVNLAEGRSTQADIRRERLNLALFGEVDYRFNDGWHLVAGGRLDSDDYEISSAGSAGADSDEVRFLPKLGIRREFREDHTLGFTVQQGYRSGGADTDASGQPYSFDPSTTWNYELSYRSTWFDDRLEVNANVFRTDWDDQQVVLRDFDFATFVADERIINAASSELQGVEIESRWKASDSLGFFASLGYLDTRFDDFTYQIDLATAAALGIPATLDFRGYELPESPRLNGSIGFDYKHQSGFFVAGDIEALGPYYSPYLFAPAASGVGQVSVQVPQNDVVKVDARATVNLSVGYEAERWSVTLFVRNLFDEDYLLGKTPNVTAGAGGVEFSDGFLATVGPPRYVGLGVNLKF